MSGAVLDRFENGVQQIFSAGLGAFNDVLNSQEIPVTTSLFGFGSSGGSDPKQTTGTDPSPSTAPTAAGFGDSLKSLATPRNLAIGAGIFALVVFLKK